MADCRQRLATSDSPVAKNFGGSKSSGITQAAAITLRRPPCAEGYLVVTPIAPWSEVSQEHKDIVKKYGDFSKVSEPTFPDGLVFAMWPYCAAMVGGLKKAGRNLTPEALVKGLESISDFDMGGGLCPKISFTPKRHVGYFSSMVLRADAKNKRFVIESPLVEPKSPQY